MKIYFVILLFSLSSWVSAAKKSVDLDNIGVRVLFNGGELPNDPLAFCSEKDSLILEEEFLAILHFDDNTRRSLRANRELVNCATACRGFPPGMCYLVYRKCVGWRRDLESETEHEERELTNDVSIATSEKCGNLKKPIEQRMEAIRKRAATVVSDECQNLLKMKYQVGCTIVE